AYEGRIGVRPGGRLPVAGGRGECGQGAFDLLRGEEGDRRLGRGGGPVGVRGRGAAGGEGDKGGGEDQAHGGPGWLRGPHPIPEPVRPFRNAGQRRAAARPSAATSAQQA